MNYNKLSKKAKKVMFITALLQGVIFAAAAVLIIGKSFSYRSIFGYALIAVSVLLAVIYVIVVPLIRYKRYRYLITADRVEIIEGVFWVKRTVVPIDRIHQISVSKGPLDSAFGVAKVSVITAGATATFRFLEEQRADEIAMHLNTRISEKLGGSNDVQ